MKKLLAARAKEEKDRPKPAAEPVKGSFAEIMARAKAIQNSKLGQPITIVHVPFKSEKTRARERAKEASMSRSGSEEPDRKKLLAAAAGAKGTTAAMASVKKTVSSVQTNAVVEKKKPSAAKEPASYKGTRRDPAAPTSSYRGTAAAARPKPPAKPASASAGRLAPFSSKKPQKPAATASPRRRRSDTPESYHSDDGSSDMEAGMTDIDAEEAAAERAARAEDLAALREEAAHRRRKEERKRALLRK
jgi:hypothetical protein